MLALFSNWYKRYFSDPEAVILFFTVVAIALIITFFGKMLAPILVSIVIAYLLYPLVKRLERWKFPRVLAVSLVCLLTLGIILVALIWVIPLIWEQLINLFNELPDMLGRGQRELMNLPQRYPGFISSDQVAYVTNVAKSELGNFGKVVLSFSLASIPNIIEIIVYVVLVPLMVFFLLKDNDAIIAWCSRFFPKKRRVITQVWMEVNQQIGNYIRGRVIEIVIVSIVCAVTFKIMGLQYALLLGTVVGVATIIPYIGAVVSTIPIVIIAFLQWGWSAHFAYLLIVYTVISIVDSNVLVPLLFSETLNLHPIAIIVAVIVFGGLWGFWGVFFAIPLATVVQAVISAWPHKR